MTAQHLSFAELESRLDFIRGAPKDEGRVEMIVRRMNPGEREVLLEARLDTAFGLVGDTWLVRGSRKSADGSARLDMQITLTNARAMAVISPARKHWPLAGDQFFVDFDLSAGNLPAGSRLSIGSAVIEVSTYPHNGCANFAARFGPDALRFVNSAIGKELHLRGINARVLQPGTVRVGDKIAKIPD